MHNSIDSINKTNFSGLVSGIDTDSLVKEMVGTYQARVDSLNADKQIYLWQQEAYQEIMTDLNDFHDKYLNVLNRDSYILSMSGTKKVSFANEAESNNFIDINVNADAVETSYTIDEIAQLATKTSVSSSEKVVGGIVGSVDITTLEYPLDLSEGYDFQVTLDGTAKNINMTGTYNDVTALIDELNSELNASFGAGRIVASIIDNKLSLSADNSIMQVRTGEMNSFLSKVGISSGDRNVVNLDRSANNLFGETLQMKFNINGTDFSFSSSTSIRNIISEVNRSDANVVMSYSTFNDSFTLQTKDSGASSVISIENTSGNFFGSDGYSKINEGQIQNGQDAIIYMNDPEKNNPIKRSSNVFTNDGVTISLKGVTSEKIDFTVGQNIEGVYEKIEEFVKSFNELIGGLESKIKEKKNYQYCPLTDAQKEEMTEKQVELWEEKAKSGLLRNDQTLYRIVNDLKGAFWDKTEGANFSFYEVGITTSRNYNKFELEIDQSKLQAAIAKDANGVLKLFNESSDISYSARLSKSQQSKRYQEVGFASRVHDIIQTNVTTLRNNSNTKGILVELIGVEGDTTEANNVFTRRINRVDTRISDALKRMNQREVLYRRQFTAMERAIQQMSIQGDALYNMFMN